MKPINLYVLTRVCCGEAKDTFKDFFEQLSISKETKLKPHEIESLNKLVDNMLLHNIEIDNMDYFYLGYEIPQIGKEFDMLKIGEACVLNIELKSEENIEDILKQMRQNKYYLSHLGKKIEVYTYVSSNDKIYKLSDDGNSLIETTFENLNRTLQEIQECFVGELKSLFRVSNFLVSPINNIDKFIDGNYFLTLQQQSFKEEILSTISKNASKTEFFAITGNAGTGKTLLIYDLAKECAKKALTLIIHCGMLSEQHKQLNDSIDNLYIISARDMDWLNLNRYEYIIIDETQRNFPYQFEKLISLAKKNNTKLFISYDSTQTLSKKEISHNIKGKVQEIDGLKEYKLSNKIRTNPSMANFIKALFDLGKKTGIKDCANVEIVYANDFSETEILIEYYKKKEFKFIGYTESSMARRKIDYLDKDINTHAVVGQEFDNVLMVIDNAFYYGEDNKLYALEHPNPNYIYTKLLYQGLTRVREKLVLIVVDNKQVYNKLLDLSKYAIKQCR